MYRSDFHIHTCYSPDSVMSPQLLVDKCVKEGITCIAVTDHNSIQGALETTKISPFKIIVGEEVTSAGGEIVGLFLKEVIPRGLSPIETVERIKAQGGLVSIPHPFDIFRRNVITTEALTQIIPYVDIVEEFNARNNFQSANRRALALAQKYGKLTVSVTDAHTAYEVGRTYTELPDFDGTADGFLVALSKARFMKKPTTPLIHVVTTITKAWKKFNM